MAVSRIDEAGLNVTQYGNRNLIINGGQTIDQRNGGAVVSNANGFITDRWTLAKYGPSGGAYSGQQVSDAPDDFSYSLKITVTTSTAGSVNDYWQAFQTIEGFNSKQLNWGTSAAKTVTVSFWVKSSVTGTYSFAFYNNGFNGGNRAIATTYTINSANTWEYKTLTIDGDGAAGASYWGTTNAQGVGCYWDLGCGDNQNIAADTWTSANARRVSGTVKLINTASATWQITGVQLEVGDTATGFEHRSYGEELALCRRYYRKIGPSQNSTQMPLLSGGTYDATEFQTTYNCEDMRAQPTLETTGTASDYEVYSVGGRTATSVPSLDPQSEPAALDIRVGLSGATAGQYGWLRTRNTTAYLAFDAEL